ncbi:MAG: TonB-dependent receptor [Clostridia bacterium]|nr:TonB-dependent receptor [Deltaproteobacteria bacterium]
MRREFLMAHLGGLRRRGLLVCELALLFVLAATRMAVGAEVREAGDSATVVGAEGVEAGDPAMAIGRPVEADADEHDVEEPEGSASYETVIRAGADAGERQADLDARTPGFANVVVLDTQRDRGGDDGLANALARTTGVTLRSAGGLGQFSSVSIRGSSAQQLAVFLDGVPLNGSIGEAFDLSTISLDVLSTAAVYRGYVPVPYVLAGLGGVIALTSASSKADKANVGIAGGSYGGLQGDGHVAFGSDTTSLRLGASAARSLGDFTFYDDNATPNVTADDRTTRRINDDFKRVTLHGVARSEFFSVRLSLVEVVLRKEQGIPGASYAQARNVRLGTDVYQTIASANRLFGSAEADLVLGVGIETRRYRDPDGELSLRSDQHTNNLDLYMSPRITIPLWRDATFALAANVRREHSRVEQANAILTPTGATRSGDAGRKRDSYGVGAELTQNVAERLRITLGTRIEGIRSDFRVADNAGQYNDQGRDTRTTQLTPRAGAVVRIAEPLELRGSYGRYVRVPTLNELFGDRGFVLGNEGLKPETGWLGDVGLRLQAATESARGRLDLVVFDSNVDDLITWQRTGPALRAFNTRGAVIRGLEVGGSGAVLNERLDAMVNYALLHTENLSNATSQRGQQLPGRPTNEVYAELGTTPPLPLEIVKARVYATADISAGLNLDVSGRYRVPPRALFGAGVRLAYSDTMSLAFAVQNLGNLRTTTWQPSTGEERQTVPISDFIGYPLPGRAFWLRGVWQCL